MDYFRLGLTNILGILAPGVLLLLAMALASLGVFRFHELNSLEVIWGLVLERQAIAILLLLLLGYLVGATVRLFANDVAEVISGWYSRVIRRRTDAVFAERFPYPSVVKRIDEMIGPEVRQLLSEQSATFTDEGNKEFYNYAKMFVLTHSPQRAALCERIEAYVRFLAGSLIAIGATAVVALVGTIVFTLSPRGDTGLLFQIVLLSALPIGIVILERFRFQHTREVFHMWVAFYDAVREFGDRAEGRVRDGTS